MVIHTLKAKQTNKHYFNIVVCFHRLFAACMQNFSSAICRFYCSLLLTQNTHTKHPFFSKRTVYKCGSQSTDQQSSKPHLLLKCEGEFLERAEFLPYSLFMFKSLTVPSPCSELIYCPPSRLGALILQESHLGQCC